MYSNRLYIFELMGFLFSFGWGMGRPTHSFCKKGGAVFTIFLETLNRSAKSNGAKKALPTETVLTKDAVQPV